MDYATPAVRKPTQINTRIIAFAAVVLLLVGFPIYIYIDSVVHGGIHVLANGVHEVDLKAMSSFPFDQINGTVNDIPKKWRELDGKKIVVVGEMWEPYTAGNNVTRFELVYSIAKCCMSGPPQVQHFVKAKVVPGKSLAYYSTQVRVTGTLHVDVIKDAGKIQQVYSLDVEDIEPIS